MSSSRKPVCSLSVVLATILLPMGMGCAFKPKETQVPPTTTVDSGTTPVKDAGPIDFSLREVTIIPGCGSGVLDSGEVCDDGNTKAGDGCSVDCKTIEPDFACPDVGRACVYQIKCGDGKLGGNERCDPPNVGNGCSATCQLELGFVCDAPAATPDPATPAKCRKTVCGDNTKEGTEACDDSNDIDGDGCGARCTLEPDCSSGTCASKCGDGVKLKPEECDDGNTKDGDGCSGSCTIEMGFSCTDVMLPPPAQLKLKVTFRDMISLPATGATRHPDFELLGGTPNGTPSLVQMMTGADGKPLMEGRCTQAGTTTMCPAGQQLTTEANFNQWFHDASGVNMVINSTLPLARQADGSFLYASPTGSTGGGGGGTVQGFFPLDGMGWVAANPVQEMTASGSHNYGFTTEIHYFFQYRGGEQLSFSGDDDVWIFVNRRLALDIGGLHVALARTLALDANAAALGLTVGNLYEISLFHAERKSTGSNFKLTLTGFAPTSTTCQSACGDGVKASIEQCDDGNNNDSDGCSHDCRYEIVIP